MPPFPARERRRWNDSWLAMPSCRRRMKPANVCSIASRIRCGRTTFCDGCANRQTCKWPRSQRRNWWNDDWRDRMHGAVTWLAGGADQITLPVGGDARLELLAAPLQFTSPQSFGEDDLAPLEELIDDEVTEEDSEEEDLEEIEEGL